MANKKLLKCHKPQRNALTRLCPIDHRPNVVNLARDCAAAESGLADRQACDRLELRSRRSERDVGDDADVTRIDETVGGPREGGKSLN